MLLAQLGIDPHPVGRGASQLWPLHHHANCWTATLFSFYLIDFFHSETNVKELEAQPGIDPRPSGFEHHSTTTTYTTVTFPFYLILFFHSWANLLRGYLKGWGPRLGIDSRSLGFEHHSLDHYTTMVKADRLYFFLLYFILFFTLKPTVKTARGPAGNRAWPTNLEHHNLAHYFIVALADKHHTTVAIIAYT